MISQDRARYILMNRLIGGDLKHDFRSGSDSATKPTHADGITEEEHAFVLDVWSTLPGSSSYLDALFLLARGRRYYESSTEGKPGRYNAHEMQGIRVAIEKVVQHQRNDVDNSTSKG